MEYLIAMLVIIGSAIAAIAGNIVASELYDRAPSLGHWLLKCAIIRLPEECRARYTEEWYAHFDECPGKLGQLLHALGCFVSARAVGRTVAARSDATQRNAKRTAASRKPNNRLLDPIQKAMVGFRRFLMVYSPRYMHETDVAIDAYRKGNVRGFTTSFFKACMLAYYEMIPMMISGITLIARRIKR